jgi:hypothetical protein
MALAVNLLVIAGSVLFVIAWYLRNRAAITPTKPSGVLRPVRIAVLGVGCNIAALVLALSGTHPRLALATLGVTAAWIGLWLPKRFRRVRVESETVFRCQAEEAFDFFSDPRNEPRYQFRVERVEQLSPQRIGVGSVFRAWVNVAHGSQPGLRLVVDEEITEYFLLDISPPGSSAKSTVSGSRSARRTAALGLLPSTMDSPSLTLLCWEASSGGRRHGSGSSTLATAPGRGLKRSSRKTQRSFRRRGYYELTS